MISFHSHQVGISLCMLSPYHFKAFLEREMYLQISSFHDANTLALKYLGVNDDV